MTQRNEPTVGILATLLGGKQEAVVTPEKLMEDALQGFTDAHAKLEKAQAAISVQVAEHEAEIESRQKALVAANESHSRLGRVAERFKELLA